MGKALLIVASFALLLLVGIDAATGTRSTAAASTVAAGLSSRGGSCNFDSDCDYGKCKDHKCGGCDFNSDCKGYGICENHACGHCNFTSECGDFGDCNNHECARSPW
jgi:hypothetical protein